MLISSLVIGTVSLKKNRVVILSAALFAAGIFIGRFWNPGKHRCYLLFGFLFFSSLPFANAALDFLVRTNIADDFQGRAWGLIGVLSQLGYVAAYAISGILADGTGALFSIGSGERFRSPDRRSRSFPGRHILSALPDQIREGS